MQREVVKWVQTLDLSVQIRNPRRDLANGFLVAEVLTRYNKDISLHSFDTGASVERKLDNWGQIRRHLSKMGCTAVTEALTTAAAQSREEAATRVMEHLFEFFTHRQLPPRAIQQNRGGPRAVAAAAESLPPFMRPTATKLLRDDADTVADRFAAVTGRTDEKQRLAANQQLLSQHKTVLRREKAQDPERFKPRPPKPVQADTTPRPRQRLQEAREMSLRTMDTDVVDALKQRREAEQEAAFRARFDTEVDLSSALSHVLRRVLDTVGTGGEGEYFAAFCDTEYREALPHDVRHEAWRALLEAVPNMAQHLHLRPEELHHLALGFHFAFRREVALSVPEGAALQDVDAALELLRQVALQWRDLGAPEEASATATQVLLPLVGDALTSSRPAMTDRYVGCAMAFATTTDAAKVESFAEALAAFVADAAKAAVVLRCALDAVAPGRTLGAPQLLLRHALRLLHSTHSTCRAVALSLAIQLAAVPTAEDAGGASLNAASTITDAAYAVIVSEPRWEPRLLALLALCALTARHPDPDTVVVGIVTVLCTFDTDAPLIRRAALCAVAPAVVYSQQPVLGDVFVARLLGLPAAHLAAVLDCDADGASVEAAPGAVRAAYAASCVPLRWDPLSVCEALAATRDDRTTLEVVTLMEAAVMNTTVDGLVASAPQWLEVVRSVRPDLADAVLNPTQCRGVPEAQGPECAAAAAAVTARLYATVSGEMDPALEGDQVRTQEFALEWLQSL